jgi:hypothetical protein
MLFTFLARRIIFHPIPRKAFKPLSISELASAMGRRAVTSRRRKGFGVGFAVNFAYSIFIWKIELLRPRVPTNQDFLGIQSNCYRYSEDSE